MSSKRQQIAILTASLALAVLVITGLATKDKLVEQWFLWKLSSKELEERKTAAERLGAMRSVRAVPGLVQIIRDSAQTEDESRASRRSRRLEMTEQFWEENWPAKALAAIGARAVPAIAEAIKDETWLYGGRDTMDVALQRAIKEMGSSAASHLMEMLDAKNPNTRRLAALVLRKLDHEPERALEALLEAHRSAWGIGEFRSDAEVSSPRPNEALLRDEHERARPMREQPFTSS